MNTLHGFPFLRKQFYTWVENNLSHLVLSWWSKETAMMINFVLKFSSQVFWHTSWLICTNVHIFSSWFHFFRTSFDFKSLNCKKISHFLSSHHQCVFQFGVWRNMRIPKNGFCCTFWGAAFWLQGLRSWEQTHSQRLTQWKRHAGGGGMVKQACYGRKHLVSDQTSRQVKGGERGGGSKSRRNQVRKWGMRGELPP